MLAFSFIFSSNMDNSFYGNTSEIMEEIVSEFKTDETPESSCAYKSGKKYSIEDDINILFQASLSTLHLQKSALRSPKRASSSQTPRIGISEPASLKQAFRGLCISQASEMAALKRLSKPSNFLRVPEAGTSKKSTIVDEGQGEFMEISLVPEISEHSDKLHSNENHDISSSSARGSATFVDATNPKTMPTRLAYRNKILPLTPEVQGEKLVNKLGKQILENSSSVVYASGEVLEAKPRKVPASFSKDFPSSSKGMEAKLNSLVSLPGSSTSNGVDQSTRNNTSLEKPMSKDRRILKMKVKQDLASSTSNLNKVTGNSNFKNEMKGNEKLSPSHSNHSIEVYSVDVGMDPTKAGFSLTGNMKTKFLVTKTNDKSRSKDEFSQNSESSFGEYSSCTSTSEESSLSGCNRNGCRPHMSKHLRWEAIHAVQQQLHGNLSLRHFKLLRRLGCGDIGTVYLTELVGTSCLFALKVMDNEFLACGKKVSRAQTEREILQMLDHPFLPTLYAHIATDKLSCLVIEYCPGGDLHVLCQRQPYRSFSEQAARFYAAEVLLALEYLHMLGVVYRNLKPENILVREDGHIMLTDFDLSLRCSANAMLVKSSTPDGDPSKKMSSSCSEASCIHPFCLQPNWQVSCFTPILSSAKAKSRKMKADVAAQVGPLPQLVVEPTSARSTSFVGTYEYLAPEIIKGEGHGSAVDWWTFGVFLFQLLYGNTPFKGHANEDTLANVVSQNLKFPDAPIVSFQARDLIRGLLIKDPENRLGSVKGAAEIKQHSFFEGLNWALVRCAAPPELPGFRDFRTSATSLASHKENASDLDDDDEEEDCEQFHLF